MTPIKDVLDNLNAEQKRLLMYAFDHGIAQHIMYEPGRFIGVNVGSSQNLRVQQQVGKWAIGEVCESSR